MDRLSKTRFTRKVGQQIPKHIRKLMAQRHPTVAILWDRGAEKWCLVQQVRGRNHLIDFIRGTMTLDNTVYALDRMHPANFHSKWQKQRFLDQLDDNRVASAVEKDSRDRVREGSSDLWNVLTNRRVFEVPK